MYIIMFKRINEQFEVGMIFENTKNCSLNSESSEKSGTTTNNYYYYGHNNNENKGNKKPIFEFIKKMLIYILKLLFIVLLGYCINKSFIEYLQMRSAAMFFEKLNEFKNIFVNFVDIEPEVLTEVKPEIVEVVPEVIQEVVHEVIIETKFEAVKGSSSFPEYLLRSSMYSISLVIKRITELFK